jgi:methylmalonyl-CoA mutase
VRGTTPLGAAIGGWDIRQHHAEPDPLHANADILDDLTNGVTSVALRLDPAAAAGLDIDDPRASHSDGHGGLLAFSVGDLGRALQGVKLDTAGVYFEAGSAFVPAAALYVAAARAVGVGPERLLGSFGADPLGTLMHEGSLPVSLAAALRQMTDLTAWTAKHAPKMTAVRVDTRVYHDAGATSVQDLAFLLATGVDYLRTLVDGGLETNVAARQITFGLSLGCRFYQAIAKVRAVRLLWARVVEACGGDAEAQRAHIHTTTGRRVITTRSAMLTILRNTTAAYAGAVGGADAITTVPVDAPTVLSPDLSRRNARNTQLILAEECHLGRVVDPAGGSWYLEWFTHQLAEHAWALFQEIEARGGMLGAAQSGWVAEQIATVEARRERDIATRRLPITGISEHANIGEPSPSARDTGDQALVRQVAVARLIAWRAQYSQSAEVALRDRGIAIKGALTAYAIGAAEAGATLGQITRALDTSEAESANVTPLAIHPFDEAYEHLRDAADAYAVAHGHRPRVFLAGFGSIAEQIARKTFANSFFQAGGFEVLAREGSFTPDEAAAAFAASDARIAVICSTDKLYATGVGQLAPLLKSAGARAVVLAGNPGADEATYRAAGVDRFIFVRSNVLQTLADLLREEGAL